MARDKFEERLRQTWNSELEPELVTPTTGGQEELTEYEDTFPLTRQFKQTNMRSSRGQAKRSTSGRGKDQN